MPTQVQFRRGTTTQNEAFTGAVGELSVDTTLDTVRVHDGSTAGGIRLAKYSEIQAGDITGVTAGTGLSGGGTSGAVTVILSHLGIESLSDPNDDQIIFWDDSAGAVAFLDITTGLDITATNLSFSHLGLESLSDTNADRFYISASPGVFIRPYIQKYAVDHWPTQVTSRYITPARVKYKRVCPAISQQVLLSVLTSG